MNKLKHCVVGYGEVGSALHLVLGEAVWVSKNNPGTYSPKTDKIDVVHICFPFVNKDDFYAEAKKYKEIAPLVIVHSSVPVGTCDELEVVHSPIRGVHPNLAEGIRTFVKYFGGNKSISAAKIFEDLGIRVKTYPQAKTTEALKLWDTTQYGILILLEKQIHKWCEDNGIDFDAIYTQANKDYNEGYTKLGRPDVVRPYLKHMPGPIGGHCVLPNAKLLGADLPEDIE
jgi:UDP-N-acetyl-D-mannosaminuronate dehydrogenase